MRRRGLSRIGAGAARLVAPGGASTDARAWQRAAASSAASTSSPSPSEDSLRRRPFDALLIDATGTLISPSEPVTQVYRTYAAKHGIDPIPPTQQILAGFRRAYNAPWPPPSSNGGFFSPNGPSPSSPLPPRFAGGGKPFWRSVVARSLGFDDPRRLPEGCFDDIYDHFSRKEAWRFAAPGVRRSLKRIRDNGVRVAIVSNFDSRLSGILRELGVLSLVDACVVSGDHGGAEKPSPVLFDEAFRALRSLGPVDGLGSRLERSRTVVVGDDRRNDVTGGRAAGFLSWHFGTEVRSLKTLASRLLGEARDDDDDDEGGESDGEDDAA